MRAAKKSRAKVLFHKVGFRNAQHFSPAGSLAVTHMTSHARDGIRRFHGIGDGWREHGLRGLASRVNDDVITLNKGSGAPYRVNIAPSQLLMGDKLQYYSCTVTFTFTQAFVTSWIHGWNRETRFVLNPNTELHIMRQSEIMHFIYALVQKSKYPLFVAKIKNAISLSLFSKCALRIAL